jgi:hypothetical protein
MMDEVALEQVLSEFLFSLPHDINRDSSIAQYSSVIVPGDVRYA